MISLETYKNIHLLGVFMIVTALGGLLLHVINGGTRQQPWRKVVALTHGIGMFLALLGGFGMLARLQLQFPWQGWVFAKLAIWLCLGGMLGVIFRKPAWAKGLWWATILLPAVAAYLALNKPF